LLLGELAGTSRVDRVDRNLQTGVFDVGLEVRHNVADVVQVFCVFQVGEAAEPDRIVRSGGHWMRLAWLGDGGALLAEVQHA